MRKLLIGVSLLAMVPLLRADVQVIEAVCPNGAKARYFEEMVSMPDGVKLYTYGAVPPDGMKCPIVIQRNPY
ncbi:MAG TPA: hypothetical protein PLZ60_09785, partial [Kiritimatiellia bacterium]|nr:hypothetical protein [Kiritimatiellia bacterium]